MLWIEYSYTIEYESKVCFAPITIPNLKWIYRLWKTAKHNTDIKNFTIRITKEDK